MSKNKKILRIKYLARFNLCAKTKTECFQSTTDDNLIYYLGGYACRSVSKVLKCEACVELIDREQNQVSLKFRDNENPRAEFVKLKRNFLAQMNRGGYFYPTDLTFSLSLHGWRSFLHFVHTQKENRFYLTTLIIWRHLLKLSCSL